jgi:hypothetical protein
MHASEAQEISEETQVEEDLGKGESSLLSVVMNRIQCPTQKTKQPADSD